MEILRIPRERVKALKGDADNNIKFLEDRLTVKVNVDNEGTVELDGEPIDVFFAIPVIKAIGRGFEPRVAMKLKNEEYGFKLIDLRDFVKKEQMARVKGRIIGLKGKSKQIIEEEGEVDMAIYGHTVGIIGKLDVIDIAATAVYKLIEGTPHFGVYLYLEKNRRRRKEEEMKNRGKMHPKE